MYRFQFEYMFYDYDTLSHVFLKREGIWRRISRVVLTCLVLFAIFFGASLVKNWEELSNSLGFAAITAIVSECIRPAILSRRSQKMSLQGVDEMTVTLDETEVHCHHGKGDVRYPWSAFVDGYYCRGQYILFLDKLHTAGLPERALVEGDPATLRAFLEEKLQKEIIDVR